MSICHWYCYQQPQYQTYFVFRSEPEPRLISTTLNTVDFCYFDVVVELDDATLFQFWHRRPETQLTATKYSSAASGPSTRVHFLTPVNSGRQLGCQKMHPSSRAVNSARELG